MYNTQIYEIVGDSLVKELKRDLSRKANDFRKKVDVLNRELHVDLVGGYVSSLRTNRVVGAVLKNPIPTYWRRSKDTTYGVIMVPNRQFKKGKELAKKIHIKSEDLYSGLDKIVGRNNSLLYSFRWYPVKEKIFIRVPVDHDSPVFIKSTKQDKILVPWTEIGFREYADN